MKEYTAAIMLEELLAKLRGADKWPEIIATVTSASRQLARGKGKSYRRESCDVHFRYAPSNCGNQIGRFKVDFGSSLYHLEADDNFKIQFDPRRPSRYHSNAYRITRIGSRSKQNGPSFFLLRLWES
jgi:hypothetical protein